ncbi:MAG: hypothetical protein Q7S65_04535 [Nanoarchaeota archaeon]|nr:hypothetical protein [Nanoarchaeota archaeon]
MNRRISTGLTLAALVLACCGKSELEGTAQTPPSPSQSVGSKEARGLESSLTSPSSPAELVSGSPYTIVQRIPLEDIPTLERSLSPPQPSDIPSVWNNETIAKFFHPQQLLYLVEAKPTEDPSKSNLDFHSVGTAFLLNQKGYFITALHKTDKWIPKNGKENRFFIFYDPVTGYSAQANIFAYGSSDIAFGKTKVPAGIAVPDTYISSDDKVAAVDFPGRGNLQVSVSRVYTHMNHLAPEFLNSFIPDCVVSRAEDGQWVYENASRHPARLGGVTQLVMGGPVPPTTKDGAVFNVPTGRNSMLGDFEFGNSGSAVFDLHGRFHGPLIKIEVVHNAQGELCMAGYSLKAYHTRNLLEFVIAHSKSSGK